MLDRASQTVQHLASLVALAGGFVYFSPLEHDLNSKPAVDPVRHGGRIF